ncbi:unconventional prefoldin RPB5 interactor [Neocloeon triangulifer]|uniref:unconventional prefoldin RPB5 interactor n=1 Tax=Neocloeon triangulifer TaxID=2078957 RepID=UPI00286EC814|nr:unconventional prefoldin RPB5 interactor [Neocloeon triangulifer]
MDDSQIYQGVQHNDEQFLFGSRIEHDLLEIKQEKQRLEGEIDKYERLVQTLERLPRELSWPVPHVALTKHALLPDAHLVSTNEVTVHIGDNWFTRCSAHHARSICLRRQQKCRETITLLKEREKLLLNWQRAVSSMSGGIAGGRDETEDFPLDEAFGGQDIKEFVSEEQYLLDKETHRQRVREHYEKRRGLKEEAAGVSDEELWRRLEELELEEQTSGELRTMNRSERSGAPAREVPPPEKKKKKVGVKFADEEVKQEEEEPSVVKLGWTWDDSASSSSDSSTADEPEKTEGAKSPPRRLSFAQHIETGSDETSVIEFAHTPVESLPFSTSDQLRSPSDIYSTFQEMFAAATTPKSILKQPKKEVDASEEWPTISYPFSYIQGDLPSSDSEYEEPEPPSTDRPEVLSDVMEKVVVAAKAPSPPPEEVPLAEVEKRSVQFSTGPAAADHPGRQHGRKKLSKFKSSRMASKKK